MRSEPHGQEHEDDGGGGKRTGEPEARAQRQERTSRQKRGDDGERILPGSHGDSVHRTPGVMSITFFIVEQGG
jgi:hypothetical protein